MTLKIDNRDEADIVRDLSVLEGMPCAGCARSLCGHHALVALVMGFKNAPRCAGCLAAALEQPYEKFRDQVLELVNHRDCYRAGWKWADRRERITRSRRPPCLWPGEEDGARNPKRRAMAKPAGGSSSSPDTEWDAGDMGCGDLVLELRLRLGRLAPGQVLTVTARDPGAPEDLPAWCRLTGHALVQSKPPVYRIRRKES